MMSEGNRLDRRGFLKGLLTGLVELRYVWICSGAAKEQLASEAGERRCVCVCVCDHGLTRGCEPRLTVPPPDGRAKLRRSWLKVSSLHHRKQDDDTMVL